ncbi:MAG: nickel pincer cofactor biosynthesis protein LarC [Pyrinomonadaceae bacterium]|nr:nickel pincer cofactor biosynthesis protein LarC [Pyrinomonadaceae bacterium]
MKTLFFDCFAGASGDMILGALIALGVDENELLLQLQSLNFSGYEITFETVNRSGLSATKANVSTPYETKHRHLSSIVKIIGESGLSESIKKRSIEIFTVLGRAEAKMHGTTIEKVHFHEVGAMDAIIDIVGACIGFELLKIENFACSALHLGSGFVKMAHGKFPVPAPAVAEILKSKNAPTYQTEILGELVTPTGAAIIATVCDNFGAMPTLDVQNIGYGAGTREYKDFPNVLRLIVGDAELEESKVQSMKSKVVNGDFDSASYKEILTLIETNIDDLSPQVLAFVQERALESGALDCWFEQIVMKKSRPAVKICILCERSDKEKFSQMLFDETTTLGVRCSEIERLSLARDFVKVQTEYGEITMKTAKTNGSTKVQPEFEDCRSAALKNNVTLREVETTAHKVWRESQEN